MSTTPSFRYGTGSEFGLSGNDQIRIALVTISKERGVATMRDIVAAVEQALVERDPQCRLSKQGKASLRFFVNKVAVDAGYIYKHNPRRNGWTITPKGQALIASSSTLPLSEKMLTPVGRDFQLSLADVYALLLAEKTFAANESAVAAYIRAGVILTVTAWETFIEGTLRVYAAYILERAATPDDVSGTFNAVSQAWLDLRGGKGALKPTDLKKWAGDGWKTIIREHIEKDVSDLNTPKSDKIATLFKRYTGVEICSTWTWRGTTSAEACAKLDELISKRGDLVHRGKTSIDTKPLPTRDWLIDMITLVEQMAWLTDLHVHDKLTPPPAA